MALSWQLLVLLGTFSVVAATVLGFMSFLVVNSGPKRPENAAFGAFSGVLALQNLLAAIGIVVTGGGKPTSWILWLGTWVTVILPVIFLQFALLFPSRSGHKASRPLVSALLGAVGLGLILLRHARGLGPCDPRGSGGFVCYGSSPLGNMMFLLGLALALAALVILWWKHARGKTRIVRDRGRTVVIGFGVLVAAGLFSLATIVASGPEMEFTVKLTQSVGALAFGLLAAWAILRYQVLDVEVVFRKGISYSATLMVLAAVWVILGELLEGVIGQVLSGRTRFEFSETVAGTVSALLVTLLIIPVERLVSRLVVRAVPSLGQRDATRTAPDRSVAIFRATLERAWSDGPPSAHERQMLGVMRRQLGLSTATQAQEEAAVAAAFGYRPATKESAP